MKGGRPKKLLRLVPEAIQRRHISGCTEESYVSWIKGYVYFHGKRHPATMGEREIEAFLMHLAVEGKVAASTQNQAFSALLFLYRVLTPQAQQASPHISQKPSEKGR